MSDGSLGNMAPCMLSSKMQGSSYLSIIFILQVTPSVDIFTELILLNIH